MSLRKTTLTTCVLFSLGISQSGCQTASLERKFQTTIPLYDSVKELVEPEVIVKELFKHPCGENDIVLEVDVVDYLKARALSLAVRFSEEDLIEPDNKYIRRLFEKLELPTKDLEEDAQRILGFVQMVPYVKDITPYTKTVVETLVEGGDCEDHTILAASMMNRLGIETVLVTFFDPKREVHQGIAVAGNFKGDYFDHSGTKYFYAETIGNPERYEHSWQIGEYPSELVTYIPFVNGTKVTSGRVE